MCRRNSILLAGLAGFLLAGIAGIVFTTPGSAQQASLPFRLTVAAVAHEPQGARLTPPPPGDGYCAGDSSAPPNSVFGLFTIGGQPAPVATLVTLTFDGKIGPSAYTTAPGGYRVDFTVGGDGHTPVCTNAAESQMGILVNGVAFPLSTTARAAAGGLVLRFDLALP